MLIAALAACASPTPPPPAAPHNVATPQPSLSGSYGPTVGDDDHLVLLELPDGKLHAEIQTVGGGEHTCTFAGDLAFVGRDHWVFDQPNEEGSCRLELTRTASELQVTADGCRYYCGARAGLDSSYRLKPR
jgi:hypothetical protein